MNLRIVKLEGTYKDVLESFNAPVAEKYKNVKTTMFAFEDCDTNKLSVLVFAKDSDFRYEFGYNEMESLFGYYQLKRSHYKKLHIVYDERDTIREDDYFVFIGSDKEWVCKKILSFVSARMMRGREIEKIDFESGKKTKFKKEYV